MKIRIGINEEKPVFAIDEGELLAFTYENLYKAVDVFVNAEPISRPDVQIEPNLGEKENALACQYKDLFEALFDECSKDDFINAAKLSKECEEKFEELDSQETHGVPDSLENARQ